MPWDVDLEGPARFTASGVTGIVIIFLVLIILAIMITIDYIKKNQKEPVKKPEEPIDINKVKTEYISKIDQLVTDINNQKITKRKAYNQLSLIIREFVFKTTKIDVLKYTLTEAKKTNRQELIELLNEYYEPEFSKEGKGDLTSSIEKTRKVIMEWK